MGTLRNATACAAAIVLLPLSATEEYTTLGLLLERGQVALTPTGLGGHSGGCVQVKVLNKSARAVRTSIPVGWVFVSAEPEVQDLIVVREEFVDLPSGAARTVTCRAFCCESVGTGPEQGEAYRTGHQAGKKLTEAAMAIARGDYPDDLAQSAIWVLSDAHDIASMGALDSSAAGTLRYAVSRISGQPAPLHTLRYADDPERVCSGRPASISRTMHLSVGVSTILNAVVLDRSGKVMAVLHDHTVLDPGAHNVPLTVSVLDWPTGSYGIHAWTSDRAGVHRMPFVL